MKYLKDISKQRIISIVLIMLYASFIILGQNLINFDNIYSALVKCVIEFVLWFIATVIGTYYISRFELKVTEERSKKTLIRIFTITSVITFLILLVYFIGYAPGGYTPDSLKQYTQAVTGEYSDWHPYFHTILFYTVPLTIFNNVNAIVLMQMLYYSLAVGYVMKTLAKHKVSVLYLTVTFIILAVNPVNCTLMMIPAKDIAMNIFLMILTSQFANIIFSKGEWLTRRNSIILGLVIAIGTLVRHNALLYTIPMLIIIVIGYMRKKKYLIYTIVITCLLIFTVKVPLYSALDVITPGKRVVEIVGMPISMILNTAKCNPEDLSPEVDEFVDSFLAEDFRANYELKGWNSIKWSHANSDVIEEEGLVDIIGHTWQALLDSPTFMIQGFYGVSEIVWNPTHTAPCFVLDNYNDDIVQNKNNLAVKEVLGNIGTAVTNLPTVVNINAILVGIGLHMLILLVFLFTKLKKFLKNFLILAPLLAYNVITMLLLSGDEYRFFLYTVLVSPVLFLLINKDDELGDVNYFYEKYQKIIFQFLKFMLVSGIGLLLDTGIFLIGINVLNITPFLANIISSFVGVSYVFWISVRKIFETQLENTKNKYIIYIVYQIIIILLNSTAISMISNLEFLQAVAFHELIAKLMTTPVTLCINFVFMKWLLERFKKQSTF